MPTEAVAQVPAFQQQFQQVMYYLGPIMQILYWFFVAAASVYAVVLLRKFVNLKAAEVAATQGVAESVSTAVAAETGASPQPASSSDDANVDSFVE